MLKQEFMSGTKDTKDNLHLLLSSTDQKSLNIAREKLDECNIFRTLLIRNISHEIRTPLNAIVGFAALIGEAGLTEETRQSYARIITDSCDQLLSQVSDIIEISNIESGNLQVIRKEFDLNAGLLRLHNMYWKIASEKGIGIRYETSLSDEEAYILTDNYKLMQVIQNLLNNSFKFTEQGMIDFGYNLKKGYLEFYVSDTGKGIEKEHQSKVFNAFYKGVHSELQQYRGTGLGLAISEAYIKFMGGKIWFRSTPGEGTVFYFTIPYEKAERKTGNYLNTLNLTDQR